MLEIGDAAPDFQFQGGSLHGLLARGPVIVYFYPADFTPICTAQACMVRDLYGELAQAGLEVIGISPQGEASHSKFSQANKLPFKLIADQGLAIAKAWKSTGMFGLPIPFGVRRVTYLVGQDGRIADRAAGELGVKAHARLIRAAAAASTPHT